MPTLTAQTGGFGWSTAWFPEGDTWDDAYAWADVAAWEANPRTPLVLGEAANLGAFTVNGQAITEDLLEGFDGGTFSLSGQDALKGITELAAGKFYTLGGQDIKKSLLEAIDFGSFTISGQAANKALTDNIAYGNFTFNGRPISEQISERVDVGTFVITGNAVNEALLEHIDPANFNYAGGIASKLITDIFAHGSFATAGQDANVHITERLDGGRFALTGQAASTPYKLIAEAGLFVLADYENIQRLDVWPDTGYWSDYELWLDDDLVDYGIVERADAGIFSLAGQVALKKIAHSFGAGIFSLEGQEGEKALPELAAGQFFIAGQDINEGISEATNFGAFTVAYQDALLYNRRYTFDGEFSTAILMTGEPNIVEFITAANSATISINTPNYVELDTEYTLVELTQTNNEYT